jgi:hypothetical protein
MIASLPKPAPPRPLVPADIRVERSLIRLAVAHVVAATRSGGSVAATLHEMFPNERVAPVLLQRAASSPASTGQAGWAAELAAQSVRAFIASLQDSAAAVLINAGIRLDLTGAARVNLPRVSSGGSASWILEGAPIPLVQGVTSTSSITFYKLACLEALSREAFEHSMPGGSESWMEIVLKDLARSALDTSLFSSTAGSAARPPGLTAGITPIVASTATGLSAVTEDFRALTDAVTAAGAGGSLLYFCSPGRAVSAKSLLPALAGQIFGSAFIPSAELFCACPGTFCSAFNEIPEITASASASLHFDDAPTDIGVPGTPPVVAAPTKGLFQVDEIAFRMVLRSGWGLRIANTASWIQTGMQW